MITNCFAIATRWSKDIHGVISAKDRNHLYQIHQKERYRALVFSSYHGLLLDSFGFDTWEQASEFCAAYSGTVDDHTWYQHPDHAIGLPHSIWTMDEAGETWYTGDALNLRVTTDAGYFYPSIKGFALRVQWEGTFEEIWEDAAEACVSKLYQILNLTPPLQFPPEWRKPEEEIHV